jgi:hypothetical protein
MGMSRDIAKASSTDTYALIMQRFMTTLFWTAGLLGALALAGYGWVTRHPSFQEVQQDAVDVARSDVEAVAALLGDAGVDPGRVLVVETEPDAPCWEVRWGWLDYHLQVYKRFGAYPGGINCVGVDGGRVVSLSIVGTSLSTLGPLADLPMVRTLQLRDNRIATLAGIPSDCRWTHLDLGDNALTDLEAVTACRALRKLIVDRNRLEALPALQPLQELETLDARLNVIADVRRLEGHPALREVQLYDNRLTVAAGLAGMPWLERLTLSNNALTTLADLSALPALKRLDVASNRLERLDPAWLAGFPNLRRVDVSGNPLRTIPDGFVRDPDAPSYAVQVKPSDAPWPVVAVGQTPLAEAVRQDAYAAHDAAEVHRVGDLPRTRGRWYKVRSRTRARSGLSSTAYEEGQADYLDGVQSRSFDVDQGLTVTVTAEVERGCLRAYLRHRDGGYGYAEAIPGKPLRLTGRLITGTSKYLVYFESVEGRAEGVRWEVTR